MRFKTIGALLALAVCFGLASCGASKFKRYNGPEVTRIVVMKSLRKMYLMHDQEVLKGYDIDLGFAPEGRKQFEGDGKTPEGSYIIDRRNPNSEFHLSLGISYPAPEDVEVARAAGKPPGGDIFIHGGRRPIDPKRKDWTWGCISVPDREIEQIYAMVRDGTRIDIYP
jgi:murein L,D-transpeptidase YafK